MFKNKSAMIGGGCPTEINMDLVIAEGKTKQVWRIKDSEEMVVVASKDDITAGDGAKRDVIPNKGMYANQTTCNVFSFLGECGLRTAFEKQISQNEFLACNCAMLPLEVVVRREAHGSYLKRNPHIKKETVFPKLVFELFLKTSGQEWKGKKIPCDDPLAVLNANCLAELFDPKKPVYGQSPFLRVRLEDIFLENDRERIAKLLSVIENNAKFAFLALEKAWQLLGCRLVDYKVEFGFNRSKGLMLADVIDNDSWRVIEGGSYIDKQTYRDGAALSSVAEKYERVSRLTGMFRVPQNQRVIIWSGSEKDDVSLITMEVQKAVASPFCYRVIRSWHKEPVAAYNQLQSVVQNYPDSVIIALVGRSNGAGPSISANCAVPVITVPANWQEFPEDVWSSLRTPSNTPVMTVLDQQNAALAALQILAARNPALYATLRMRQEERLPNAILL